MSFAGISSLPNRGFGNFATPSFTSPSFNSKPNKVDNDVDMGGQQSERLQEHSDTGVEYQKFARLLETLQRQSNQQGGDVQLDIGRVLPEFDTLCSTRAQQFERRKNAGAGFQVSSTEEEHKLWESESNTWLLLETLFSAFERQKPFVDKGPEALEWSDLDLIEHLHSTDSNFKHHSAVKSWLEVIAPPTNPRVGAKRISPSAKSASSLFSQPATTTAQTNYQDPDATTRDGVKLDEYNQRVEHDLLLAVWEYIRRGQVQKAKDACENAGEPWRAESISGGDLYSVSTAFTDPQYDREEGAIGNKTRGLWKGTCYALAKESTAEQYERAIYGALCGDIPSVLPVCSSWEDHAWVRYNALVESMIENRLSQFNRGGPSKALPIPTTTISSAKDIFDSIDNSDDQKLRNDSKDMFKTIQTSIILGQTDQMLTNMAREARSARKAGAPLRPHMLRFMAHFVLLLRSKKSNVPKADGDFFIKSYVDLLISKQLYDIAPLYASFLPRKLQIETCSSYLKTIDGSKKERLGYLANIRKYGLDLHAILTATVDGLLEKSSSASEEDIETGVMQSVSAPTTAREAAQIKSLEWLTFETPQYLECLFRSNHLIRQYLADGRLNAAYALYTSLPLDIAESGPMGAMPTSLRREHTYYGDLFAARRMLEKWRSELETRPRKQDTRMAAWKWDVEMKELVTDTSTELENLLRSKWLFDCILPGDNVRAHELRKLRQIYLSEIALNLHEVYFQSRNVIPANLEKSVEMANLIAAERGEETPLHKELQDNGRLQELLAQIRLSSLELINLGRSPFAY
ncbi:nuclear pore protein 84/107 [Linnemannia elongata AG-77]|uniref:Nuclear pore complex protein n=1 Tax=Linnemannia elongata AG-77 TaxID=1314771 RepID=A0A197JXV1_9FUNG|nr:nuclear pore protein 84/107 [Linnemannia elongata AG-77]